MSVFVEKARLVKDLEKAMDSCDGYAQCSCPFSKILDQIEDGFYDWSAE